MSISSSHPQLTPEIVKYDQDADVVVVGGGPIGLSTAIQTKLLSGKKVVVLEKYEQYQRSDIRLNISPSSFSGMVNDPKLKKLTDQWGKKPVPIKDMEEGLSKRANELGIKIIRGYQADPKTLPQLFPNAKLFVGADGARSIVRKEIFNDQYRFNSTLQYMAQVQYIINEKPPKQASEKDTLETVQKFQNLSETYQRQKFAKHLIIQNIKPQEDGSSKVTLQIFIDKETYDKMSDATFKNPYYFETSLNKVPESLREVLIKWWGSREGQEKEVITADKEKMNKITVIALGSYSAQDVVKEDENKKVWVLVGDAAAAFPFFRAINNGFLLSTFLAKCIAKAFEKQEKDKNTSFASSLKSYSQYTLKRVYIERIRAFIKNIFIILSSLWIKISALVPWQAVKLSEKQKKEYYELGAATWTRLSGSKPPPVQEKRWTLNKKIC